MSDPAFAVPDAVLDDLQARLQNTGWPLVVEGQGWARGTDLHYLDQLVDYWRTGFDWRYGHSCSQADDYRYAIAGPWKGQHADNADDSGDCPSRYRGAGHDH